MSDGGDIVVTVDGIQVDGGLATSVYLSLFGGNETDPGIGDSQYQWWGNIGVDDPTYQYRSQTQWILLNRSAIPANLIHLERAIYADLQWMTDNAVVSNIVVELSMVARNRVDVILTLTADSETIDLRYEANWRANL